MKQLFLIVLAAMMCACLSPGIVSAKTGGAPPADSAALGADSDQAYPSLPEENIDGEDDDNAAAQVGSSSTTLHADTSRALNDIKEAESLYQEATEYYKSGNTIMARNLYRSSLRKLAEADINTDVSFLLREEFGTFFNRLGKAYDHGGTLPAGASRIPLDTDNELVQKYLRLYAEGGSRDRITKALERSGRYRQMILSILKEYNLPEELVYLPVVESLYSVNDVSHAGAVGLWQIMPTIGRDLGLKINTWVDERRDPEKSTRAAARYLRELYLMFDDWHLALAAYNRGENGLLRDLKYSNATTIDEMSKRKAVPRETERYVPQFIACTLIGTDPKKYGFAPSYESTVACDTVTVSSVVDLNVIAQCAGTSVEAIRELNPSLRAWCTPYNYPDFILRLPPGTREQYLEKIAQVKDLNPSRGFVRYKVAKGDTLQKIAKKFGTTVAALRKDNKLKSKKLRPGRAIVVRPGKKFYAQAKN